MRGTDAVHVEQIVIRTRVGVVGVAARPGPRMAVKSAPSMGLRAADKQAAPSGGVRTTTAAAAASPMSEALSAL
jgi:hypothetical protein